MPIFAFRSWLFKFRIWSYLHHKNVSDKQRKSKEKDFNLHYMFFRIIKMEYLVHNLSDPTQGGIFYIYVLFFTKFNLYKISLISYAWSKNLIIFHC